VELGVLPPLLLAVLVAVEVEIVGLSFLLLLFSVEAKDPRSSSGLEEEEEEEEEAATEEV
jgi:hypothetical protein